MNARLRVSAALLSGIWLATGLCAPVHASAEPASADQAWNAIYQPIEGLTADTVHKTIEQGSAGWWNWRNRWRRQVSLRGMAFWDAYPQDERRWEWLYDVMHSHRLEQGSPPMQFADADSRETDAAWGTRRMELRAALMSRALANPGDRKWQGVRWHRLYRDLTRRIENLHERRMHGETVDLEPLLDDLVDYCIEMHLADAERGLSLGHLVTCAIDLALQGDLERQAKFIDALAAAMHDLPPRQDILRPRLREYVSGTLRPLHQMRLRPFELRMTSMDGGVIDLEELRGKVVLVDFWNTSCSSCVEAMPHIQQVYDRYRAQGFEVVGVVFNSENERRQVEKLIDKAGARWPQALQGNLLGEGRSALSQRFNFTGVPWTFLLDKTGRLVSTTISGELLEQQVRRLLGLPAGGLSSASAAPVAPASRR